ncbi:hypothetical protein PQX77_005999 [Marasmius sp. AFHP31]|nr:hypothetical protein PQX77_005999 [Marasmius sp. AFHP31]
MVVTYTGAQNGLNSPQGLNVDYFHVTNDWVQNPNGSSPRLKGKRTIPIGAIIGGVLGGVFALIAIAGLIWWMMRRRKRQSIGTNDSTDERSTVTPFDGVKPMGTGTSTKHAYGQRDELNERVPWERDSGIRFNQTNASSSIPAPPPSYTSD